VWVHVEIRGVEEIAIKGWEKPDPTYQKFNI